MILQEKAKDLIIVGEDTSKKAKISSDKLAKLQYLLTKGLYKDPITAVIAEWTNNGIDSVVQAGKNPIENPVVVTIGNDKNNQAFLRVEDKGIGLDDKDFEDICMNYLESTKEDDNDTIGHFGIGMKSFLSLERAASFTCRKNGVERKYVVYEGAEFVNYDLIYQQDTDEENGVIAETTIQGWAEKHTFVTKAKAKLAYYDTVALIVDGVMVSNTIHRNELFQWSTQVTTTEMHVCLKDVYYPIDWEALNIRSIPIPVGIRLKLGDGMTPTPSRESYITNEKTRALLLDKIRQIADWFVEKYNETVKEFPSFLDAYDYLGVGSPHVELKDSKNFDINCLLGYSGTILRTPKVKGITLQDPNTYKLRRNSLLNHMHVAGYKSGTGVVKTGRRLPIGKESHVFDRKGKTVLVGEDFIGNVKDYLKQKYPFHTMFVKDNGFVRKLGTRANPLSESYRTVLSLTHKPRNEWIPLIKEWDFVVSTIVSTFEDERKVAGTQAYLDWLDKKRAAQKAARVRSGPKGAGLGKQTGDITLAYSYSRYGKVHFKKAAMPIANLAKNAFVTVLIDDWEEKDIETIKGIIPLMACPNIKFATVGKLEKKKLPEHYQFITIKQFMSRDCKPFMRLVSALKYEKVLEDYQKIANFQSGKFKFLFDSLDKDVRELRIYVMKNAHYLQAETKGVIMDVAIAHNLFDDSIVDVYNRVQTGLQKFDFINLIKEPNYWDTDTMKKYTTLINQILLFRRKYYNDIPEDVEITVTKKV